MRNSLAFGLVLLALLVALPPTTVTAEASPESSHSQCADLLSSAFDDLGRAESTRWVGLFEEAIERCEPAELPADELVLYYRGRGEYLGLHDKDYAAAVEAYEQGLDRVDAVVSRDDPIRIALLDGLANAAARSAS